MGCEDVMNLRNLSQEELIKMINEKDKKIEALTEQLNWYSQQIKLQQKKLFGSSSEKTVLPDQISLFDEIGLESTPIKQEPELEEITYRRKRKSREWETMPSHLPDIPGHLCQECLSHVLCGLNMHHLKRRIGSPFRVIQNSQKQNCKNRTDTAQSNQTKTVLLRVAVPHMSHADPQRHDERNGNRSGGNAPAVKSHCHKAVHRKNARIKTTM